MNRSPYSRTLRTIFLLSLLPMPTFGQDLNLERKFAPVPDPLSARPMERLNQFLDYDRAAQYEKKYDLFFRLLLDDAEMEERGLRQEHAGSAKASVFDLIFSTSYS